MNKQSELLTLISSILDIDLSSISLETQFADMENWDSLAHVHIIGEIEDTFNIKIPFESIQEIKTINDFMNYIK